MDLTLAISTCSKPKYEVFFYSGRNPADGGCFKKVLENSIFTTINALTTTNAHVPTTASQTGLLKKGLGKGRTDRKYNFTKNSYSISCRVSELQLPCYFFHNSWTSNPILGYSWASMIIRRNQCPSYWNRRSLDTLFVECKSHCSFFCERNSTIVNCVPIHGCDKMVPEAYFFPSSMPCTCRMHAIQISIISHRQYCIFGHPILKQL